MLSNVWHCISVQDIINKETCYCLPQNLTTRDQGTHHEESNNMNEPAKTETPVAPTKTEKPAETKASKGKPKEKETARETIESIVFAFVLAFLFRTFEAEAFVIPTGSMAPTLFGRHKDLQCEQCGYTFQFGASSEVTRDGTVLIPNSRIHEARCPNCRYSNPQAFEAPPFKGDRILVNKFQYELGTPKRFDVVVFKYPEDSKTNFIKRLVGLPGETIRIHHGNLYRVAENGREEILRKSDPNKQRVIQIPVYNDNFPSLGLQEAGWPNRWAGVERTNAEGSIAGWSETPNTWKLNEENRSYQLTKEGQKPNQPTWLRYRHFAPKDSTWISIEANDPVEANPRLIGDFCGYNTIVEDTLRRSSTDELFWVGDLNVTGSVEIDEIQEGANFTIELTEGIHWYRCHLNPSTGDARLVRVEAGLNPDEEIEIATAKTSFKGIGSHSFWFANVDDRLCLWIDDDLIDFGEEANYESSELHGMMPDASDYTPVGIAMQGMTGSVSDLRILRDIYYRGSGISLENGELLLDNVSEWQRAYRNHGKEIDFFEVQIPEDNFFVLGDNSPMSSDGRFWESTHTVPRQAFVGKAFYIYWPHAIPMGVESGYAVTLSYHKKFTRQGEIVTDRSYPLHYAPFYPNFWRMKRIR
ncbi:signal peptidase I [Rubinisphaera sp.]|uniref:signal peptidase I n=1 Tax=Rubinisphaera sp. TaxID=2024857 RepID=UPI0025E5E29D|nr:signal peptidase I [Rubinisphaera sp.]|tara:strand:+ start:1582 stop:3504 length:1923 start_codon:yes stop_codon:yes gene_type:complete